MREEVGVLEQVTEMGSDCETTRKAHYNLGVEKRGKLVWGVGEVECANKKQGGAGE